MSSDAWHEKHRKYREELSRRIADVFELNQVYTHDEAKKLLEAAGSDDPREDIRVAIYQHDLLLRNDWTVVRRAAVERRPDLADLALATAVRELTERRNNYQARLAHLTERTDPHVREVYERAVAEVEAAIEVCERMGKRG